MASCQNRTWAALRQLPQIEEQFIYKRWLSLRSSLSIWMMDRSSMIALLNYKAPEEPAMVPPLVEDASRKCISVHLFGSNLGIAYLSRSFCIDFGRQYFNYHRAS